jgi:hypothetical protein
MRAGVDADELAHNAGAVALDDEAQCAAASHVESGSLLAPPA